MHVSLCEKKSLRFLHRSTSSVMWRGLRQQQVSFLKCLAKFTYFKISICMSSGSLCNPLTSTSSLFYPRGFPKALCSRLYHKPAYNWKMFPKMKSKSNQIWLALAQRYPLVYHWSHIFMAWFGAFLISQKAKEKNQQQTNKTCRSSLSCMNVCFAHPLECLEGGQQEGITPPTFSVWSKFTKSDIQHSK